MKDSISLPDTASPIEDQLDCVITIAGYEIDAKKVYLEFKDRKVFGRIDVRSYIAGNGQDIPGWQNLKDAIARKHPNDVGRILEGAVDELIEKLENKYLLSFPKVELSPEFELTLIKEWASHCHD